MIYYLDSSAAVKLYVVEAGSDWLHHLLLAQEQTPVALSSHLLCVEIWSAFARRLRDGTVTATQHTHMNDWFLEHRHALYSLTAVNEAIIQRTHTLFVHHPLRAYDAMHLATALLINQQLLEKHLPALTFLCADDRLLTAAAAEGLAIDNPNAHP